MSDEHLMCDCPSCPIVRVKRERDEARSVARALWMCWSYREKEERDKGLMEWIKENHAWIMEE